MNPINVEKLLSHSIGISNSYYRPTENELFEDYLKVVDMLSLNKENSLQKQLSDYKEKNDEENHVIKGKLHEKDEQIKYINEKYEKDIQKIKEDMNTQFLEIMKMIQQNPLLAHVKPEVLGQANQ